MQRTLGGYGRILGAFCAQFQDCLPILLFAYGQVMPLEIALHERHSMTFDRKSTRLNSSHLVISYAVFCLKKKNIVPVRSAVFVPPLALIGPWRVACPIGSNFAVALKRV